MQRSIPCIASGSRLRACFSTTSIQLEPRQVKLFGLRPDRERPAVRKTLGYGGKELGRDDRDGRRMEGWDRGGRDHQDGRGMHDRERSKRVNWRPRENGGGQISDPTPPRDPTHWAPTKKLTFAAMAALRALHQSDPKLHHRAALGEKFGISYDAVGKILRSRFEHKELPEQEMPRRK